MKTFKSIRVIILVLITSIAYLSAQPQINVTDLNALLPIDKDVKIGKLNNGLKYYIRKNLKPEKRAELRLAVKTGSVMEDDNQRGLAHLIEHMCFNGTKNFPKNELINFLQSTGVKFGADLNAYTSFDETVYMLEIPTDKEGLLNKGIQVLEDWGHNVSFDNAEIDKERGVVVEEWRLGKGAQDRVMKKQLPVLLYNSRYADRLPIGDTAVLYHCNYERLTTFYKDWYRPDLMAVVAVGDFNVDEMEKMIQEHFAELKNPENEKPRTEFPLPDNDKTLVSIATDKEMPRATVSIHFKHHEGKLIGNYAEYRKNLVNQLLGEMINRRFDDMRRKKDAPFLFAGGNEGKFFSDVRSFDLMAMVAGNGLMKGFESIITEGFRAMQHGFLATELDRAKKEMLRSVQKMYDERDKTNSKNYTREYVSNFLQNESMPGMEYEYALYSKFIPEITLAEINTYIKTLIHSNNSIITMVAPEKPEIVVPTEAEAIAKYSEIEKSKIEPYKDAEIGKPLFSKTVNSGKIIKENKLEKIGVTELFLSNGAKVILKPTDFKNDEILFKAFSPGGTSIANDADFISANFTSQLLNESGVSQFDESALQKLLSGKEVSLNSYIDELNEGLEGSYSPKDDETFFQLLNLIITEPRIDEDAYQALVKRTKESILANQRTPEGIFRDSVRSIMTQYHFRKRPMTEEMLKDFNAIKAFDFYKDRFADVGDFTFFFVGNVNLEKIKPLIEKYVASLPTQRRKENWKDIGSNPPQGKIEKTVKKGVEKKGSVNLVINGDCDYNADNRLKMRALSAHLSDKLREEIREEKSGTYGIRASGSLQKYPKQKFTFNIMFGCDPTRANELIDDLLKVVDKIKTSLPDEKDMKKITETFKREYEVNSKENRQWLGWLENYYWISEDPNAILNFNDMVNKLKPQDIKDAANQFLNMNNFAKFILVPEK
ncbi:MAG: insulinase family protein [Candidatus Kapabacteria bacterium]|nr:insulinase family protein [Candidatus Kapabacteria bacterium]